MPLPQKPPPLQVVKSLFFICNSSTNHHFSMGSSWTIYYSFQSKRSSNTNYWSGTDYSHNHITVFSCSTHWFSLRTQSHSRLKISRYIPYLPADASSIRVPTYEHRSLKHGTPRLTRQFRRQWKCTSRYNSPAPSSDSRARTTPCISKVRSLKRKWGRGYGVTMPRDVDSFTLVLTLC